MGDGVYLQLTEDLRDAPDLALAALRDFLEPLLIDAPVDRHPSVEPYRVLEAPLRAPREYEIPPLRPLGRRLEELSVENRPLAELDGDVVVVAAFEQATVADVEAVIDPLLDDWYEKASGKYAEPPVHNMGSPEYVAHGEHVEMNVWLDIGSATDRLLLLIQSIERTSKANGWRATVSARESYET
jgi:hypothetical protein